MKASGRVLRGSMALKSLKRASVRAMAPVMTQSISKPDMVNVWAIVGQLYKHDRQVKEDEGKRQVLPEGQEE